MSMHKIPLTETERNGLKAHGLDIGKPSQLSDVFRLGVAWGIESLRAELATLKEQNAVLSQQESEDTILLSWLIRNEAQVWEVNGLYSVHDVTEHHPVTKEFRTPREAIRAAISQEPMHTEREE